MKSSFTNIVSGFFSATAASRLRNGEPTLPVCIASSIFVSHATVALSAYILPWSSDHGGVRSLCGRRGMKKEKSAHGRSRCARLTVDEKSGGGSTAVRASRGSRVFAAG